MPKTSHNKTHKQRLEKFKMKKQMENKKMENQQPMPEIRNFPIWEQDAQIVVSGREWEILFNTVMSMQESFQAVNAVMSRNIMSGVVRMDFEKLNPKSLQYEPMSDEEKAPISKDFNEAVENIKIAAEKAKNETPVVQEEIIKMSDSSTVDGKDKKTNGKVVNIGKETVAGK